MTPLYTPSGLPAAETTNGPSRSKHLLVIRRHCYAAQGSSQAVDRGAAVSAMCEGGGYLSNSFCAVVGSALFEDEAVESGP